jgi:ABC-2 type transport system ATP-binding protein
MSGGEQQRLALAAATLHEPELLFLDEPTSAVDPESRRAFWETLFGIVDEGTTILVSTHYMDEAERCHQLAILDRGVLRASGQPQALMDALRARVVEVRSERTREIRRALAECPGVESVAQLGRTLRVLLAAGTERPAERVRSFLAERGLEAGVGDAEPSLEDVFVDATRRASDDEETHRQ